VARIAAMPQSWREACEAFRPKAAQPSVLS